VPAPVPDHLYDFLTAGGATAGIVGVALGAGFTFLYGRRASVSIAAKPHETPNGLVIATRPTVKAVGVFRVKFRNRDGIVVRLVEVYVDGNGDLQEDEETAREHTGAFEQQYVDPGEELTTTVTFSPTNPPESVIGWTVYLGISAPTRLARFRTGWWADQIFVARPISGEEV